MTQTKTLREIITSNFEGFARHKMEFWSPEDLPNESWTDNYEQLQRFTQGENFEEIDLRTWICTDTHVGLRAILWDGELLALTYQPGRKCDRNWWFVNDRGEKRMWWVFNSYAEPCFRAVCKTVSPTDRIYETIFDPTMKYDWETGPL